MLTLFLEDFFMHKRTPVELTFLSLFRVMVRFSLAELKGEEKELLEMHSVPIKGVVLNFSESLTP